MENFMTGKEFYMRVKKAINNNVLCAVDEKGHEVIVMGKGLGFGKKPGQYVDESAIQKIYRMESKSEQKKLKELVESIPIEHIQLTQGLIDHISHHVTGGLNESLLITLSDHISFAIKRKEDGIEFEHPLKDAIMSYYPIEYKMGQYCLQEINKQLNVELIDDEAAFIALHIVNAELNTHMSDMLEITKLIENCTRIVEDYYQKQFDKSSLDFARFVVHLRYFAKRFFHDQMMPDKEESEDIEFRQMVTQSYRRHYQCVLKIEEFIRQTYGKDLPEEEKIFLTLHLKRINKNQTKEDEE